MLHPPSPPPPHTLLVSALTSDGQSIFTSVFFLARERKVILRDCFFVVFGVGGSVGGVVSFGPRFW